MIELLTVLENLGYPIKKRNNYYQTAALFRGGDDPTSVTIYPENNFFIDFVTGEKGPVLKLIQLHLKHETSEQTKEWLKGKNIEVPIFEKKEPKIKQLKSFSSDILKDFVQNHKYWLDRHIDIDVLREFKGGVLPSNFKHRLHDRYVFPVFDDREKLIGLTGRALKESNKIRWMHFGEKTGWCYPLFLNYNFIQQCKSIILVEGIGDILSLFTVGIRNCACLFGTELSLPLLNSILKMQVKEIIISTNNDEAGINSANSIKKKLCKYFDARNVKIYLPTQKDINLMLIRDGNEYVNEHYLKVLH